MNDDQQEWFTRCFWPKVDASGECWLWTASLDRYGYGQSFSPSWLPGSKMAKAHRMAYAATIGPIPNGLVLDHLCRVRRCVNPAHLEPVTGAENARRAYQAHETCRRGHAWTIETTIMRPTGRRTCRICHSAGARRRWSQRRAERVA